MWVLLQPFKPPGSMIVFEWERRSHDPCMNHNLAWMTLSILGLVQSFRTNNEIQSLRLQSCQRAYTNESNLFYIINVTLNRFKPSTLSIGLIIDWHINLLSPHDSSFFEMFISIQYMYENWIFQSRFQTKPRAFFGCHKYFHIFLSQSKNFWFISCPADNERT